MQTLHRRQLVDAPPHRWPRALRLAARWTRTAVVNGGFADAASAVAAQRRRRSRTRAPAASRVATFGLFLGIALCGSADAVTSATRLGPDGGPVDVIRTSGRHVYAIGYQEGDRLIPGVGGNAWVSADSGATWHPATAGELAALPKALNRGTARHPRYRRVMYRLTAARPIGPSRSAPMVARRSAPACDFAARTRFPFSRDRLAANQPRRDCSAR